MAVLAAVAVSPWASFAHGPQGVVALAGNSLPGSVGRNRRILPLRPWVPGAGPIPGQRYDAAVGLYDYRARWYDPALGRFIQRTWQTPR